MPSSNGGLGSSVSVCKHMATIPDVTPLCQGEEIGEQFDIVRPVGCDYRVKMVGTSLPPSSEK